MSELENLQIDLVNKFVSEHPRSAIKVFDNMSLETITDVLYSLGDEYIIDIINLLPATSLSDFFQKIDVTRAVKLLTQIDPTITYAILETLPTALTTKYKKRLPHLLQKELQEIKNYPLDTAGAVMDSNILIFTGDMSVARAINKIKYCQKKGIRILFVVDDKHRLASMVTLQGLLLADQNQLLKEIATPVRSFVQDMESRDDIVTKLEKHKLTDIPVVNNEHQFIGVVRHHTLIKITQEEMTKDLQTMVGVSPDERALSPVLFSVKKRLPWLQINLLTAFLAASVVSLFETTIAQFTALAVLLPVVAGQSGNTGAQALAVTMRGLALKEVRLTNWLKLIVKECKVSIITGLSVAITTAFGVFLWSKSIGLTFIIGISMIISMLLASISGALVPIILRACNQDPAQSSSIILTTVTDVCGFFSFLGIATILQKLI